MLFRALLSEQKRDQLGAMVARKTKELEELKTHYKNSVKDCRDAEKLLTPDIHQVRARYYLPVAYDAAPESDCTACEAYNLGEENGPYPQLTPPYLCPLSQKRCSRRPLPDAP